MCPKYFCCNFRLSQFLSKTPRGGPRTRGLQTNYSEAQKLTLRFPLQTTSKKVASDQDKPRRPHRVSFEDPQSRVVFLLGFPRGAPKEGPSLQEEDAAWRFSGSKATCNLQSFVLGYGAQARQRHTAGVIWGDVHVPVGEIGHFRVSYLEKLLYAHPPSTTFSPMQAHCMGAHGTQGRAYLRRQQPHHLSVANSQRDGMASPQPIREKQMQSHPEVSHELTPEVLCLANPWGLRTVDPQNPCQSV